MKRANVLFVPFFFLCLFVCASDMHAQNTLNAQIFEQEIQPLHSELKTVVMERFQDFSNEALEALMEIAEEKRRVRSAHTAVVSVRRLETWMADHLTQEERQRVEQASQLILEVPNH